MPKNDKIRHISNFINIYNQSQGYVKVEAMASVKIKLKKRSDIVKFQFLYSLHQHLGWARSNKEIPEEISIFTTDDLIRENKRVVLSIGKWVRLELF